MIYESDHVWFDDDVYIGSSISFPSGVWKLERKITEHEYYESQTEVEECRINSEARGVFIASNLSGSDPRTAIVKFRLQIPWAYTTTHEPEVRAKQADPSPNSFYNGIKALSELMEAHCSCTPRLFDFKRDTQNKDEWVPGGYKVSLLMERLPGFDPSEVFWDLPRAERDLMRAAFKEAWLETVSCGVRHSDSAMRNLLWDEQNKKCYLIDWELWAHPGNNNVWKDSTYVVWHLAEVGPSWNYLDMSDWKL